MAQFRFLNGRAYSRNGQKWFQGFFTLIFIFSLLGVQPVQPVQADAASIRVSQGSDDAEESVGDGSVSLTSSDLELINDSGDQIVGIRFQGVAVPPGATIQSAHIEFETDETSSDTTELVIHCQAADNPMTFTDTDYDISGRPVTSASVAWSPDAWNTLSQKHQTSDLSTVIQEIVDRGGWVAGNAMVFIIEGSGSRVAEAYEGEPANAPLLAIEYILSTGPTITTLGALSEFTSEPGEYSAEQSYTVSGSNLTSDIMITPPVDFEISLTSGSGWVVNPGSITLTPDGGASVAATEIFVRFLLADAGISTGDITHTSTDATQKDVTVTGTASAPLGDWVAYNDCVYENGEDGYLGDHVTTFGVGSGFSGDTSGELLDQSTGNLTGVTVNLTQSGGVTWQSGTEYGGADTADGTDANDTFGDITDMIGVIQYGDSGWYVDMTFTGLDQSEVYTFATSASRNNSSYTDRYTIYTLSGVDSAENASTAGVNEIDNLSVWFNTGDNHAEGYVARWANIQPGSDGSFMVRAEAHPDANDSGRKAYGFDVFMLAEEISSTEPTITTSGALDTFSTPPGVLSAAQTYTVSGNLLTEDITITAPSGFLLSLDDSEYTPGLVLLQTGGEVAPTTIFVALYSESDGSFAGNIVHTSAGANSKNVEVSGEVSYIIETSFQNGVNGYDGTVDTFVMQDNPSSEYGAELWVEWDGDDPNGTSQSNYGLLRFEDIFGSGGGQIPPEATILEATLTYVVSNSGDSADINETAVEWLESVTYNTFGSAAGVQAEDYGLSAGSAAGGSTSAFSVDVTASIQRWLDGETNFGWIFRPTGDDGIEFRSSEYSTASDRPKLDVTYTVGEINDPPDAPVLVGPLDGAINVSLPPTLEVTVTDPEADPMDVSFYGRPVGEASGEDFVFIAVPDTQRLAESYPSTMIDQFQWIAIQDTVFVTSLGDIVNVASSSTQWDTADSAYDLLDIVEIPYSVGPGNHDLGTLYSDYFGSARFAGKPWYQGYYTSGNDNYNNYSFFSAGGMDFIVINLQYDSTTLQQTWADGLLKDNPDRRGIVVQHNILNIDNSWQSQAVFNALKDNPNLFMMLCGHMHSGSDGSAYRAELGDAGQTIHILLTDYQDFGDNDNLRLLTFKPADDEIYAQIYSPQDSTYLTSASNYEQFTMAYDMTASAAFELIGTDEDVASGGNASISWPDLADDTEYEWYVEVGDGHSTTNGPTWGFTTGSEIVNQAPELISIGNKSVDELVALTFTATATDDGLPSDTLTFSLENGTGGSVPSGASIDETTGEFAWTPSEAEGPDAHTFDVCVSDGELDDCETIIVTVNEVNVAPVLDEIGNKAGTEETLLTFMAVAIDGDLPAPTLTFTLENGTGGLVPSGASINPTTGEFTWTPAEEQGPGTYTFDVCVSDGELPDCETIEVTVNENGNPPVQPSSFWGEIQFVEGDGVPEPGDTLEAFVPDAVDPVASDTIELVEFELVYAFDVPGDDPGTPAKDGGIENDVITFKIDGRIVATADWVSGTNVEIDIHPPKADAGGPYVVLLGEGSVLLSGSATDWGTDVSAYAWDLDDDDVYDDSTISDPSFAFSAVGTYSVKVKVIDDQAGEGFDETEVFVITLGGLENQVFDGNPHQVTVEGVESPYSAVVLYGDAPGSETPPTNAGTYAVLVQIKLGDDVVGTLESELVIAPKAITVIADSGQTKVYGEADPVFTYTPSEAVSFSGALSRVAGEDVGDYAIELGDLSAGSNYEISFVSADFTILAKAITVRAASGQMKVYGEADTVFVYTSSDSVSFTGALSRVAGEDVGAYAIELGDLSAGDNYEISFVSADFTILAKALTVTADSGQTKIYGEGDLVFTYTPSEAVSFTGALSRVIGEDVGAYAIELGDLSAGSNYEISFISADFTITARSIEVTADDQTKLLGEEDPELTYQITGGSLVNDDVFSGELTRESGEDADEYVIQQGSLSLSANYQLTFIEGTFTILVQKHSIDLVTGWNLVSFNLQPNDMAIEAVLESIEGDYTLVYAWDATVSNNNWKKFDPSVGFGNTLTDLNETMGFWIYMTADATLNINGNYPQTTEIPLSTMGGGWNLVGYPSAVNLAMPGALEEHGLGTNYLIVFAYKAPDSLDQWKLYDPDAAEYANDLTELEPGWGYWIKVTQNATWEVAY